jgi:PhnB protein
MQWNPYLGFNGNCQEAFKYYERVLGGKIVAMITHADMPAEAQAQTPPDWKNKIMHARLVVGDQVLMGSDAPPNHFETTQGMSVALQIDDPNEAERIFAALADNGTVRMPIQPTFWAIRFGMLTDRFGIPWMVNCEKKN